MTALVSYIPLGIAYFRYTNYVPQCQCTNLKQKSYERALQIPMLSYQNLYTWCSHPTRVLLSAAAKDLRGYKTVVDHQNYLFNKIL